MNDPDPFCESTAANTHYMCMDSIPASPDFCSAARARAYSCQFQFDPLTDFINYSVDDEKRGTVL